MKTAFELNRLFLKTMYLLLASLNLLLIELSLNYANIKKKNNGFMALYLLLYK